SDLAKPDGLLVVEPGTEVAFLRPLEVRRLWGVGPATAKRLAALGVHTVGDLAALPEAKLVATLGNSAGHHLHALAHNRDERAVEPDHVVKSVGHEETFPTDVFDRAVLRHEVVRLADRVGSRLRAAGRAGRTVQLKVRYGDFRTITRSRTLPGVTDLGGDIAGVAGDLLEALPISGGVRLLGVSVQQLAVSQTGETGETGETPGLVTGTVGRGAQGSLFEDGDGLPHRPTEDPTEGTTEGPEDPRTRRAAVERSLDAVRARFGSGAIGPGTTNSLHREGSEPPTR
ncbi:MAG TPA: hypothetical protein VGA62_00390, partial [Acidimicrobiia bacterium]